MCAVFVEKNEKKSSIFSSELSVEIEKHFEEIKKWFMFQ
jgi:hypothetical protein